jgi:DNA-binding MarR family transcriptional regulator
MNGPLIHEYLERLSNLLRTEARRSGTAYGLQPVQLQALHYLAICNRYSDTPLAVTEYLGLTKGTVSQTLMVLENKGLIAKTGDKEDKRVVHLKVTRTGKRLVQKAFPAQLLRAVCTRLSEAQQQRVIAGMKTLLLACQEANRMRSFGACHTCRHNQRTAEGGYLCGLTQEPLSSDDIMRICREHA